LKIERPKERIFEMKDLKGPDQQPTGPTRAKQIEQPAKVYVDLLTGEVCADGFDALPNSATEDPGVRIVTKRLSNASVKASGVGTN
jgi:hypothetical protein